jgi:hypothetical protein
MSKAIRKERPREEKQVHIISKKINREKSTELSFIINSVEGVDNKKIECNVCF